MGRERDGVFRKKFQEPKLHHYPSVGRNKGIVVADREG
jgi:hypothetical protein